MIRSIEIQNFQCHGSTRLDLAPGVNAVIGETSSGKTSILRAINWVMTNRPRGTDDIQPRGLKGKAVETRVTITTDRGVVSRVRKKSFNGYEVQISLNEVLFFKDISTTVPPEVLQVLNLGDLNIQDQMKPLFLIDLPAGQISKHISSELGFEVVDLAVAKGKSHSTAATNTKSTLEAKLGVATDQIDAIGQILDGDDGALQVLKLVDNILQSHQACRDASSRFSASIADSQKSQARLNACEVAAVKFRDAAQDIDGISKLLDEVNAAVDFMKHVEGQLRIVDHLANSVGHWKIEKTKFGECESVKSFLTAVAGTHDIRAELGSRVNKLVTLRKDMRLKKANLDYVSKYREAAIERYQAELSSMGVCPYCGSAVLQDNVDKVLRSVAV